MLEINQLKVPKIGVSRLNLMALGGGIGEFRNKK